MHRESRIALAVLFCINFAAGQQAATTPPSISASAQQGQPTVYYNDSGVTTPELIPIASSTTSASPCRDEFYGLAVLLAVVDADGIPHDIEFLRQIGNELDATARQLVESDRFKPGTLGGISVPVAVAIEVDLSACKEKKSDETGRKRVFLQLRSAPTQALEVLPEPREASLATPVGSAQPRFGNAAATHDHIVAPVVLHSTFAEFSDEARKAKMDGDCLVSLIVDTNGMPQNIHMVKILAPSLDLKAMNAIKQYRFKPAMKDGKTPVAVPITIEVDFRLY